MDSEAAKRHLATVDPVLYQAIKDLDLPTREFSFTPEQYFQRLAEDIIGQQLSVKVAQVITDRFLSLFPNQKISPELVLSTPDETLRGIGMSGAKIKYVKDLAEKTVAGSIEFEQFQTWDDETVIQHLTLVKGIGRWTAEMFLMFTLGRTDVFSAGDLGLIRAMERIYGLSEKELRVANHQIANAWAPYRTYACFCLWKTLDNTPQ